MKKSQTYFLLLLGTLFWGINFHFAQIATSYVSPMAASAVRYFFATVGLIILFPFIGLKHLSVEVFKKTINHIIPIGLVGLSGVFLFNYFFFKGLSLTQAINGALLVALNPMLTLIISSLLIATPVSKKQIYGIAISLFGVLIVITHGNLIQILHLEINRGDLYLFIASILFAFHNVLIQKYLQWIHPVWLTLITTATSFLLFVLSSWTDWHNESLLNTLDNKFWLSLAAMGVLGTTLSFTVWNNGIKQVGAGKTAIFLNLVPIFAVVSGLFFGQIITLSQIFGGAFIGLGIYLTIRKR